MNVYKGGRFPNIDRWIRENGGTVTELARRADVPFSTVRQVLMGENDPGLYTINALLRATGMTFEEAFWEGDSN